MGKGRRCKGTIIVSVAVIIAVVGILLSSAYIQTRDGEHSGSFFKAAANISESRVLFQVDVQYVTFVTRCRLEGSVFIGEYDEKIWPSLA